MSKINTEEINNLRNTIKSNMRSSIEEYKSKSKSINSRLESIIRSYSEYGDVTSKAREIIRDLDEIQREADQADKMYNKIVDGLKMVVSNVKEEERNSNSIIKDNREEINTPRLNQREVRGARTSVSALNIKSTEDDKLVLEQEEAIEIPLPDPIIGVAPEELVNKEVSSGTINTLESEAREGEIEILSKQAPITGVNPQELGVKNLEKFNNITPKRSEVDLSYIEGGNLYEKIGDKIYKNGVVVSEENYKYIPKEIGGIRLEAGRGTFTKAYAEGGNVYEKIGEVIYKNGVVVSEENYKYIPQEIGGLRAEKGQGNYVIGSQTYVEAGVVYQKIGEVIYKNGVVVSEENYKYIPKEIGGLRELEGNGDFAQGYKEGGNTYVKKGNVIYKNGKEIEGENYKYIPKEIGGLRETTGNGSYIINGIMESINISAQETDLEGIENVGITGWVIPEDIRKARESQCKFLDEIAPYVAKIQEETGIPWQIMASQVCLESGYGKDEIIDSKTGERTFNIFGIKYSEARHGKGNYVEAWTNEEIKPSELASYKEQHPEIKNITKLSNGNYQVRIKAKFAKFESMEDAFGKYKDILLNQYFKHALRNGNDPIAYIKDIQSQLPGESHPQYATDSQYVNKIIDMMKTYGMLEKGINIESNSTETNTNSPSSSIGTKIELSVNTKGPNAQVKQLQQKLNELGYTDANGRKLVVDGCFGANTLAAVNKYKNKNDLSNTGQYEGIVGITTWEYLLKDTNKVSGTNSNHTSIPNPNESPNNSKLGDIWCQFTQQRIKTLHPSLQNDVTKAILELQAKGIYVRVTQGYRTFEQQQELYDSGKGVTKAQAGQSYHNYGLAFDIVEMDAQGKTCYWESNRWNEMASVFKKYGFEWGGDWKGGFKDKPHFQRTYGYNTSQLKQMTSTISYKELKL